MEEIVIAVLAKIAEYTVRPVGRWLCYSCHYKSNIEYLKNQEMTLRDAQKVVERKVKTTVDNGDEIEDYVKTWLRKVDGIIHQLATKKFGGGEEEAESRNSNLSCLNLKQRHQISREAKKMVDNITKLLTMANFPSFSYMTFDSRISITKRIMEALRDTNINKIGVWGLPGVGKSTLMKEIFRKAKEENLFDEVALANVTDNPNLRQIQEEIADMLDLKLDPNCKTEMVRAGHLRARLEKDKEKKILVILDDIWKRLDLEEIGIIPSERCKVLLTSRDRHILASEMVIEENSFKLDTLGREEAWNLFEKMAGDFVKDDLDLRNTAIEVAKACGGLPIALVTVSRALKGHKNLRIWKDALEQLRRPPPEHDTQIWSPIYTCIQLSYKHLVGRELQSLFLLCAQQGYYISYRDLLRYGFSLCLFHGIDTLDGARNRLEYLVRKLQDACLILQSPHSSEEFYMHDVVRHVATIIASNDHNMFVMRGDGGQKAWPNVDSLKRCEVLSVHGGDHIHKYLNEIECPKLRYFYVQCESRYLKTRSSSFQGMDKLEVLSLRNIQLSSLLPLTNLQTLCLDGCQLGDIHWIGELKTLVILSLAHSDISNLPREIGSLTRLRLLDLTYCFQLRVIPPNVLPSLVNLEELYMRNINVQWEVEGPNNKGKNASLAELKKLSHLITLEIDIKDANNLPTNLFSEKLERYKIRIGDSRGGYLIFYKAAFSRTLELKLNMSNFQLDFGIKMLLRRTEYLYLDELNNTKSVLYELDREDIQQLKHLHIQNNGNIMHLPELRTSFKNLKVLNVEDSEKLRFIFSSSIARGLSLLEELRIRRCNNVGAIFVKEEEEHRIEEAGDMMFRRLQTLVLMDLPKLVSFLSTRETNSEGNDHDLQVPLLHHQLSFPSLKNLCLTGLPKIKHVWSNVNGCESLKSLTQLKSLEIEDCEVMEEIVTREDGTDPTTRLLFPSPTILRLDGLPKLKWFFQGMRTLESSSSKELDEQGGTLFGIEEGELPSTSFQKLRVLELRNCEKLRFVFSSSIARGFSLLEELKIERCNNMGAIVVKEEKDGIEDGDVILFHQLQSLVLEILPELVSFLSTSSFMTDCWQIIAEGNRDLHLPLLHHQVSFPSLQTLRMKGLPKIKHVWSCGQEPKTVFRCLDQLKILEIEDCEVEEIVAGGGGEGGGGPVARTILAFSRLTDLRLKNLKRFKWFYKGMHVSKWPMLKEIWIRGCEKVEIFASGVVSFEETVEERPSEMSIKQPLFLVDELSFSSLKMLRIENMDKLEIIWQDQVAASFFSKNIQDVQIHNCEKLLHVFQSNSRIRTILTQRLTRLFIWGCSSLETIFRNMEGHTGKESQVLIAPSSRTEESVAREDGTARHIEFPTLTQMTLVRLPKLKWILEGMHTNLECPSLEILELWKCEQVIWASKFASSSCSQETSQQNQLQTCIQLPLPNLLELELGICHVKLPSTSFKKLRVLKLENCEKLRFVFSSFIASDLSLLEKLEIRRCNNMGAIVVKEEKDGIEDGDVILFHQLQTLVLEDLPELVSFLSTISSFMIDCRQIIAEGNRDLHMPLLHHQGELHSTSFQKLRVLELKNCEKLRFVFSSSIARGLSLLEELKIERCNNMGAIVVKEEKDGIEDGDVILFHQLQTLVLEFLPELVSFLGTRSSFTTDCGQIIAEGNHDLHMPLLHHQVSFPSLQTLRMKGLPKIKHVWSCGQEPKTVFNYLEQLKIVEIEDCEVEEIVAGGRGGGGEAVARTILEFPRVTDLKLINLKRLKWFYKGVHVSKWPMLEEIWIRGCEKVEIFASGVVSFEETAEERPSEMSIKQPLFLVDELSFSSLKKLRIQNMDKLEIVAQDQVAASSFSKNIQDIWILDCSSLQTIFRNMEGHNGKEPQVLIAPSSGKEESVAREDETARHIEFPILTEMRLARLPKLKWILEGVHTNLECPSLKILRLSKCEQVIWDSKFASSSQETSQQNQLQTCIQLPLPNLLELQVWISGQEEIFPYELVDPVPRLKRLELYHLPMLTHLWKEDGTQPCPLFHNLEFLHLSRCRKLKNIVPSSVFLQNLTELHISYCDGLINLLTSSTAKTLVQLKKMTVMECKRITEIVAMEDGEANVAITFNKLAYLQLDGLPNLTHFCSGTDSFGFPSLKQVFVTCCPEMKTFCHRVSSTPKLRVVYLT